MQHGNIHQFLFLLWAYALIIQCTGFNAGAPEPGWSLNKGQSSDEYIDISSEEARLAGLTGTTPTTTTTTTTSSSSGSTSSVSETTATQILSTTTSPGQKDAPDYVELPPRTPPEQPPNTEYVNPDWRRKRHTLWSL